MTLYQFLTTVFLIMTASFYLTAIYASKQPWESFKKGNQFFWVGVWKCLAGFSLVLGLITGTMVLVEMGIIT